MIRADIVTALRKRSKAPFLNVQIGVFDLEGTFRGRRVRIEDIGIIFGDPPMLSNVINAWDINDQVYGSGPFGGEELNVDLSSARCDPFEPSAAIVTADYAGPSRRISPRTVLETQVERALSMGYEVRAALEFEVIILDESAQSIRSSRFENLKPFALDNRCFAGTSMATYGSFLSELELCLRKGDVPISGVLSEIGAGCFELTLRDSLPMRAAEDAVFCRTFTKAFCRQRNLTAAFMSQLGEDFPGLGGHVHLSLQNHRSKRPEFGRGSNRLMKTAMRHFVGGLIKLTPELMALVCQTPNAYRRLTPGNWAPRAATWAEQTHTVAVRTISAPAQNARVEYRIPGADTNPFLAIAVVLGAGLWGIENKVEPPDPSNDDGRSAIEMGLPSLPHDLWEATDRLEASTVARGLFGNAFIEHFVMSRRREEMIVRKFVSPSERARYIDAI